MQCGMPKGTSQAEVKKKNQEPVPLAIVKLCEGISQSVSQSVENSI